MEASSTTIQAPDPTVGVKELIRPLERLTSRSHTARHNR